MTYRLQEKPCPSCKTRMIEPLEYTKQQWNSRKYCSSACIPRKSTTKQCENCGISMKLFPCDAAQKYCSRACSNIGKTGRHLSEAHRLKLSKALKGLKRSAEYKKKISGANSHLWKGGITPIGTKIRNSPEYAVWRKHVFQRDDYTCQACGQRGGKIQADHELSFALYPDLRFEILNGRTLCIPCHKLTPTYLKRPNQMKDLWM